MATRTLAQIQKQIAKLQREADAIKSKEMVGVIERIRDAVGHYGLTPEHIFGVKPGETTATRKSRAAGKQGSAKKADAKHGVIKRPPVAIKYQDDLGNAWTGRGSQPRWLRTAIEDGMSLADFAVKP